VGEGCARAAGYSLDADHSSYFSATEALVQALLEIRAAERS
jgi:hypothetical protein